MFAMFKSRGFLYHVDTEKEEVLRACEKYSPTLQMSTSAGDWTIPRF